MKSVYVTELGAAFPKKPAGIPSVRCVPAAEYNRMRRAVEWVLDMYGMSAADVKLELARRAGLRWNGKKWVEGGE